VAANPFNSLQVVGKNGLATSSDVNRVQDQVRQAFAKLKTGGIPKVTSRDGSIAISPATGTGSVDLAVERTTEPGGSSTLGLGGGGPAVTTLVPAAWLKITIGSDFYIMPVWKLQGAGSGPPLTGLLAWYRGDAGITEAGGTVSNWADQSGLGNDLSQATGANQPTYDAGGFAGGIPSVDFSTTDSIDLENSGFAWGTEWSVTIVFQMITLANGRLVDWFYPTSNREIGTGSGTPFFSDSGTTNINGNSIAANTTCRLVVTLGAGTVSIYSDDLTTPVNTASLTETATPGIRLGSLPGTGQASNCRVSEMFIHDHALTPPELTQLDAYLTGRGY
jgi:hypothetical protein